MNNWQYWLLAGFLLALLVLRIWSKVARRRQNKQRDFARKLETVLKPKEEILVIASDKNGRCILTNQRLLFDTRDGFQAVSLKSVKSLSGLTAEGKKTTAPAKMVSVTIKAGQEYTLYNKSAEFVDLVKELKKKTAKKKTQKS